MTKTVKIVLLFFSSLIIMSASCKKNDFHFYDIDGPGLLFHHFINDQILFQYNEPVRSLTFSFIRAGTRVESFSIDNACPRTNIYVDAMRFKKEYRSDLQVESTDVFGNNGRAMIQTPVINEVNAVLEISEIRIKYSKKRKQRLIVSVVSPGSINGYALVMYIRGKPQIFPFEFETVTKTQQLEVVIESAKEGYHEGRVIQFSKGYTHMVLKYRLSQTASLLYLLDNRGQIIDHLLYYNLKKHDHAYYHENKGFTRYLSVLKQNGIEGRPVDISNTTSTKVLIKHNEGFKTAVFK